MSELNKIFAASRLNYASSIEAGMHLLRPRILNGKNKWSTVSLRIIKKWPTEENVLL